MGSTLFTKRYAPPHGRHRKKRPKTFKSKEAAENHGKALGTKFSIIVAKKKKFAVKPNP